MRKYILTRAELIEDLKNGKKVYKDENPQHYYEMIDGIVCGQLGENTPFLINCTIDMDDILYTEEELLTIEVGNFYRTRDGRKAYCYLVEEDVCYFALAGHGHFLTDKSGNYEGAERGFDVLDYWE